ncbi:fungal-specific transcription factor domain-containing protein [Phyllosticta capitalensis]|uniref:Fungal-specific transcription factor domain-containing protein n=1 Tax=Phyllosticta capitalensis TaxID=121624 RepID=A0ABR1YBB6_9PEZI
MTTHAAARPQVGIDRLPQRRVSNEPREAMNCKSCRKRKIKCNRLKPTCEACQVFACPCIYDAVPKKRGPKTDVLEALLKRVDGLEKRLHEENKEKPIDDTDDLQKAPEAAHEPEPPKPASAPPVPQQPRTEINPNLKTSAPAAISPPQPIQQTPPYPRTDILLDAYFARLHGKPYYILDELTTRQRLQHNQLPSHLAFAIYAVSARYVPHSHVGGYSAAVRASDDYATRSRLELDPDEPCIESLQTLLLLSQANYQAGRGKKAYMLLTTAISMAFALELHRELPMMINVPPSEREGRRRLFWACYLMDRFLACGSKRPSQIADECIFLRLPSSVSTPGSMMMEGDFFRNGSNMPYVAGPCRQNQSSSVMLIGITRILGVTNRYLAAGGVKGDSHFPWHSLSNLSKIRHELDMWATETQETFSSLDNLFGHQESTLLVLSKLIYHIIHCLIYRTFLPMDLAELSITGQHQSWQIEATNLCFLHANAIAELVEIGRTSSIIDWPAFVGYCVGTAGTIHVHGAHYQGRDGEVYSTSAEFLAREMQQLAELRFIWAGVQHQRDTLQWIYGCHSELVKSMAGNSMRFSPTMDLEDFFDRYPGHAIDGAHVTFQDLSLDTVHDSISLYSQSPQSAFIPSTAFPFKIQPPVLPSQPTQSTSPVERRRKRRCTTGVNQSSSKTATSNASSIHKPTTSNTIQNTTNSPPLAQADKPNTIDAHRDINVTTNLPSFHQQIITPFSPTFTFTASFTPDPAPAAASAQHSRSNSNSSSNNKTTNVSSTEAQPNGAATAATPAPSNTSSASIAVPPQPQVASATTPSFDAIFSIPTPQYAEPSPPDNDVTATSDTKASAPNPHTSTSSSSFPQYHPPQTTASKADHDLPSLPPHTTASHAPNQPPTPGAASAAGSTISEEDPFLTFLQQLTDNEATGRGGPSDLDFFLS